MMLPQMRVHQAWYLEMAMARAGSQTIEEGGGQGSRATSDYDLTVEPLAAERGARVRLILDLQADGFNLTAIERLLSGSDGLAERLLGLRRAVTTPFEPESPELVTAEELAERFGDVDGRDIERIRKLKLLVPLGDDRFEVTSPALMGAAEQVMALGISLHTALEIGRAHV